MKLRGHARSALGLPLWKSWAAVALFLVACTERVTEPRPPRFSQVGAVEIPLVNSGDHTIIDGAFLGAFGSTGSSGTGIYHSFVRVSSNGISEQGYNTSGRPLQFDENSSPTFTKDLPLNRVPLVKCGAFAPGEFCREFDADINQQAGPTAGLLDLLRVRLFISTLASLNKNSSPQPNPDDGHFGQSAASTSLVWDLDGGTDGNVYARFNYNLNPGSGKGDAILLVPVSKFPAAANTACQYNGPPGTPNTTDCGYLIYLYSQWGTTDGTTGGDNNDGFEEWSTRETAFVTVAKTAVPSFTRTYNWQIHKSVDPTSITQFNGQSSTATWNITVSPGDPAFTDGAASVTGSITITNPGSSAVTMSIADAIPGFDPVTITCPSGTSNISLAAGASYTCTYSVSAPNTNGGLQTNTATVTLLDLTDPNNPIVESVFTGTATFDFASVTPTEVDKNPNVYDNYNAEGEVLKGTASTGTFSYQKTYTCAHDAGSFSNTARVDLTDPRTDPTASANLTVSCLGLEVTKDAQTALTRTYKWLINKDVTPKVWNLFTGDDGTSEYTVTVTPNGFDDMSWSVSGNIHVHNPNSVPVYLTGVTDALGGVLPPASVSCPAAAFPTVYTLVAGATLDCTYSSTLPDGTDRTNTATATAKPTQTGTAASFTGTASVSFTGVSLTEVNKTVDVTDSYQGGAPSALGQATFGTDPTVFTFPRTFTCDADKGKHDNTATITQTSQTASASVTVNCYAPEVTKDAATSFNRTWTWTIDKSIDETCFLTLPSGDSYNATTHTVTIQSTEDIDVCYKAVINATSADGDFNVTGNITVTNHNPERDAIITALKDVLPGSISGNVDCGAAPPFTVAKNGGELKCTYSGAAKTDGTNTATATLENHSYSSDGSSKVSGSSDYKGTAPVAFSSTPTEEIDECVSVSDLLQKSGVDAGSKDLGSYCASQGVPHTFSYKYSFGPAGIAVVCGDNRFDNTATLTTNDTKTDVTDAEFVNISVQCNIGCTLTLGYWKTHNATFDARVNGQGPPPDETWGKLDANGDATFQKENEPFFLSGQPWYQVFWTKPQGNAYYILADQYMAAVLNGLAGASQSDPVVAKALGDAKTLFETYTPAQVAAMKGYNPVRQKFLTLANILDQYNQGIIGPGHCTENVPT